jgi:hypothetical protein
MDSEQNEENTEGDPSDAVPDDRTLLQSVWIRYYSILANTADRKFVESKFRHVLYGGAILWLIHLIAVAS